MHAFNFLELSYSNVSRCLGFSTHSYRELRLLRFPKNLQPHYWQLKMPVMSLSLHRPIYYCFVNLIFLEQKWIILTGTFEWIKGVKNASFVDWVLNLSPYNAVITLGRWHLLLIWWMLHHYWWGTEDSMLIDHFRGTSIYTFLLLEHFRVWNLRADSHWGRNAPCNVMWILGTEYSIWNFDFGIGKNLHPVVTSWMHCRLHGRRFLFLTRLLVVRILRHIRFLYSNQHVSSWYLCT